MSKEATEFIKNVELNKQMRTATTYDSEKLQKQDKDLYNRGMVQYDMNMIDTVLKSDEIELQDEERAKLEAIQGRNLSTLLILQEKNTGDSKAMKDVKKKIADVERLLQKKNTVWDIDSIDFVLTGYEAAISSCKHYVDSKDPTFKKGKERLRNVQMNLDRLLTEAAEFRVARELLLEGDRVGLKNATNAHQILVMAKTYGLSAGQNETTRIIKSKAPSEKKVKELGNAGELIYKALSGSEAPSDIIARLAKSKDKKENALAKELPNVIADIRSSLSEFQAGKLEAKVIPVGGSFVYVYQNSRGQARLSCGKTDVALERTTGLIADALASDIVKNEKTYGKNVTEDVVRDVTKNLDAHADNASKRQLLTDYLISKTGYKALDFANLMTTELSHLAQSCLEGKNIIIVKSERELKNNYSANDIVLVDSLQQRKINVRETKELLDKTKASKIDVKQKVKLAEKQDKKEKKEESNAKNKFDLTDVKAQEDKAPEELEWNESEERIKNLLSDIIFSYETWTADEKMAEPGVRMRLMLQKNAAAVSVLVSDIYKKGNEGFKLVDGILDKICVFGMDNEAFDLKKTVRDTLTGIVGIVDKQVASIVKEKFPDVKKRKGELDNKRAADKVAKEEAERKKKEEQQKQQGGFLGAFFKLLDGDMSDIKNGFKAIGSAIADEAIEMKEGAEENLLNQVSTEEEFKKFIVEYITDSDKLKTGNIILGIPSMAEIIADMKLDDFAKAEETIDSGVEKATEIIQQTVNKYSGELFKPENREKKTLKNADLPDLDEAERKKIKKENIETGNEMLNDMVKDAMTTGASGQGLFTKLVFEKYFTGVSTMDKRAMIGSMIKNAKPQGIKLDENEKGISQEEKDRREAHNRKVETDVMANYIGGLLKGAGPLFQKMMQGLPLEGIPDELKGAIKDMKSKLAPIPDEIVEAELYSMVQRSHGQIKEMKVISPLGAASVGQTFLCEMTTNDGHKQEVAVKLLKPDVNNRMQREKGLMISCARETDVRMREEENRKRQENGASLLPELKADEKGGMQTTYEGQLQRVEEELDLTIEARNVELGKLYDEKKKAGDENVAAMKLNTLIAPTSTSMVLEKAPGQTIDSLLEGIKNETDAIKKFYLKAGENPDNFDAGYSTGLYSALNEHGVDWENLPDERLWEIQRNLAPEVLAEQLAKELAGLKKKKKYLDTFAYKWTNEGVFEGGFYHGDPHDGNIMIDDEKLTIIDFGNCTKLDEDQQLHVTRMLTAASIGDMDTFRHGFHMLLKPEFESLYQEKREELGKAFTEIFSLGDKRASGSRIAVALLKAQEMGLEIPASVYNFSQAQIRLQNTLDNFNKQIEESEKVISLLTKMSPSHQYFDMSEDKKSSENRNMENAPEVARTAYVRELASITDNADDISRLFDEYEDLVQRACINPLKQRMEIINTAKNGFLEIVTEFKKMDDDMKAVTNWDLLVETNLPGLSYEYFGDDIVKMFTENRVSEAEVAAMLEKINSYEDIDAMRKIVESYDTAKAKKDEIVSNHDGMLDPTDEEKAEFERLKKNFTDRLIPFRLAETKDYGSFNHFFSNMSNKFSLDTDPDNEEWHKKLKPSIDSFFKAHPEGEQEFRAAFEDFRIAMNKHEEEKNKENNEDAIKRAEAVMEEKKAGLKNVYRHIMTERLREKYNSFDELDTKRSKDFLSIMSDVITDKQSLLISRMGFFKTISVKWTMDKQDKQAKDLGIKYD